MLIFHKIFLILDEFWELLPRKPENKIIRKISRHRLFKKLEKPHLAQITRTLSKNQNIFTSGSKQKLQTNGQTGKRTEGIS